MLTQEQIQELEAKHKRIAVVRSSETKEDTKPPEPEWLVVLRRPTGTEWKLMKAIANDPKLAGAAGPNERCFRMLVVQPVGPELEALLEEWPGVPDACAHPILELAGAVGASRGK